MANRHTDWPKHYGEKKLAENLSELPDDRLHLWFSIDSIPGVKDIDVLIWHEEAGIFVVEVKAVPLSDIEIFSWDNCAFKSRGVIEPPHRQASQSKYKLINFLKPRFGFTEFISHTACWPLISRVDWNRAWDDKNICGSFSESMIFIEDLTQGSKAFIDRLRFIRKTPPSSTGLSHPFKHDTNKLEILKKALNPRAKQKKIPSDLERLRILSDDHRHSAVKKVPPEDGYRILFEGLPGSGKTFLMLQIGLHHAFSGRKVLFLCFNKVLASDIRRLLSQSEELRIAPGTMDIYDAWDLVGGFADSRNFDAKWKDHDEHAIQIVQEMKKANKTIPPYDTILIDEAQDMKQWAYEMAELHSRYGSSWCIAAGKGQELYGKEAKWLTEYKSKNPTHNLRRCFRNTKPVFQVAHIFYENAIEGNTIHRTLSKFSKDRNISTQLDFEFDRETGLPPRLTWVDDQIKDEDPSSIIYNALQSDKISSRYEGIIREQLEQLKANEFPIDLLLLVPTSKGNTVERDLVVDALKRIIVNPPEHIEEIGFIDYTLDGNRRHICGKNQIRLCTFHSARGIEAHRVVIFGFERIEKIVKDDLLNKLGYITLSRSLFDLIIAVRTSCKGIVIDFVEEILNKLREFNEKPIQNIEIQSYPLNIQKEDKKYNEIVSTPTTVLRKQIGKIPEIIADAKLILEDKTLDQRTRLNKLKLMNFDSIRSISNSDIDIFIKLIQVYIKSPRLSNDLKDFIFKIKSFSTIAPKGTTEDIGLTADLKKEIVVVKRRRTPKSGQCDKP